MWADMVGPGLVKSRQRLSTTPISPYALVSALKGTFAMSRPSREMKQIAGL